MYVNFPYSQSMWIINISMVLREKKPQSMILISLQIENICALEHYFDRSDGIFAKHYLRDEKTNISKQLKDWD